MLIELEILNFALIDQQRISFGRGLNVLSGETGAGKSVVLQAIQLLIGARPKHSVVRAGASQAEVRGVFDISALSDRPLEDLAELCVGPELVIARTVSAEGRGKVFINGKLSSVTMLEQIGARLVNICGQHQHVRLLDSQFHREVLDRFGEAADKAAKVAQLYAEVQSYKKVLQEKEAHLGLIDQKVSDLKTLIDELKPAAPRAGLRSELEQQVSRISAFEKIAATGQRLLERLEHENGIIAEMQLAMKEAEELRRVDGSFSSVHDALSEARGSARAAYEDIQQQLSRVDSDQDKIEELRDKLAEIARLERKYRCSDGDLQEMLRAAQDELSTLQTGVSLKQERARVSAAQAKLVSACSQLTEAREKGALELTKKVEGGLKEVGIAYPKFEVLLSKHELNSYGAEDVMFLFSANKGVAARPLKEIASGGELSRLLLVVKEVLSDRTGVNVLVFDEVDSGVSGSIARSVGLKLRSLAKCSQVICVTHLPQVASLADRHLLVEKQSGKRASTFIRALDDSQKLEEIARMLAGYEVTAAVRESARELLTSKR